MSKKQLLKKIERLELKLKELTILMENIKKIVN